VKAGAAKAEQKSDGARSRNADHDAGLALRIHATTGEPDETLRAMGGLKSKSGPALESTGAC
jgi:hypothetical protein